MRAVGLLAMLTGCIILLLPMFNQLLHVRYFVPDASLIGGSLICLGIAALVLARSASFR